MRVVFMGTPSFAAEILSNLIGQHDVVAVYTRADAVRGRGKTLVPTPVKRVAQSHAIPVYTPRTLRDPDVLTQLASVDPDIIVVAAYGMILPADVLNLPPYGCINVHASMLPRWRGAAPIERAILAGDTEAGVCIMRMEEGLDTGPWCVCRTDEIGDKNASELTSDLADLGSQALLTALTLIAHGEAVWTEQDTHGITYAEKVAKEEFYIHPFDPAVEALRKVQASAPAHPARCIVAGRGVALERARLVSDTKDNPALSSLLPARLIFSAKKLYLGCVDGSIEVLQVHPDGKKSMTGKEFAAGIQGAKSGDVTWEALPDA